MLPDPEKAPFFYRGPLRNFYLAHSKDIIIVEDPIAIDALRKIINTLSPLIVPEEKTKIQDRAHRFMAEAGLPKSQNIADIDIGRTDNLAIMAAWVLPTIFNKYRDKIIETTLPQDLDAVKKTLNSKDRADRSIIEYVGNPKNDRVLTILVSNDNAAKKLAAAAAEGCGTKLISFTGNLFVAEVQALKTPDIELDR